MPYSDYQTLSVVDQFINQIGQQYIQSILDVGVGFGLYGCYLRSKLDVTQERYQATDWILIIDGVEIYSAYLNPHHKYLYDNLYVGNIQKIVVDLKKYTLVLLIDVLEHFNSKYHITELLNQLSLKTNFVIASIPINHAGRVYLNNKYEKHNVIFRDEGEIFEMINQTNLKIINYIIQNRNAIILLGGQNGDTLEN